MNPSAATPVSPLCRGNIRRMCRCCHNHAPILAGAMVSGFVTDLIGIHLIFSAFVFGLTIPNGGDFVSGLLLPLYFASSELNTDLPKIRGGEAGASDSRY
ncbi:hypothetical protein HN51_053063 [Arachis hypogaea]